MKGATRLRKRRKIWLERARNILREVILLKSPRASPGPVVSFTPPASLSINVCFLDHFIPGLSRSKYCPIKVLNNPRSCQQPLIMWDCDDI